MEEKTLRIELSCENMDGNGYFYSTLDLPATEYEIRDALQRIRAIGRNDGDITMDILECPVLPSLVDTRNDAATLKELEFFAKRLASLGFEERLALNAVIDRIIPENHEGEIISMKNLINTTYGLDTVMVAAGVGNDEELGEFVIENEMHQDVASMPKDALYLLDRKRIGALQRKTEGGRFVGDFYVVAGEYEMPEVYDGKYLPSDEPPTAWYAFGLQIAKPPVEESEETEGTAEWISLPMSKITANGIAHAHGEQNIEDCVYYGFESSVPQITSEMFSSMADFDKLNALAEQMAVMSPDDQVKFKAALEAEKPADIDGVLDVAEHLHQYELNTGVSGDDEFFKSYLAHHLDSRFDMEWLDTLLVRAEGGRLLDRLGAMVTPYGAVSARGRSLYEIVPYNKWEAKELTTQALTDEKLDVIEVMDRPALFSNGRLLPEEIPAGLYAYDLRMSDDGERFCSIENKVSVNHGGTVLLKEPLTFGDVEGLALDEDSAPNFLGYEMTPEQFQETDFTQIEDTLDEEQTMGGM